MHAFVPPFCCGWPGWMRSMPMPSLIHRTKSLDRPKIPLALANGQP